MQWSGSYTHKDNKAEREFAAKRGFSGHGRGIREGKMVSGSNAILMYTFLGKVLSWGSQASQLPPLGLLDSLGHSHPDDAVH